MKRTATFSYIPLHHRHSIEYTAHFDTTEVVRIFDTDGHLVDPGEDYELRRRAANAGDSPCQIVEEVLDFLTGTTPEDWHIPHKAQPRLTRAQAWTAISYLKNLPRLIPGSVMECDMCGAAFDCNSAGSILDYGRGPHCFCGSCMNTETWYRKARRNPDKDARPE